MKSGWIFAAALVLAACGQATDTPQESDIIATDEAGTKDIAAETAAPAAEPYATPDYAKLSGYSDDWYLSPGWPGEYPAGFVVLDKDVSVQGRDKPNPDLPQDHACALPQLANYQLWNNKRVAADQLDFFVATKTFMVTMTQDAEIEYISDAGMQVLNLKQGDQMEYLRYLGEGFAILGYNGEEYDINEAELLDITDIGNSKGQEDEWVRVACADGSHAWLLYDDVIAVPGIAPSPITGYGEAADITADQVETIRAEAELTPAASAEESIE